MNVMLGQTVTVAITLTQCDVPRLDVLNVAGLCPAISVVGLFYLFTVMFTFVVDIELWSRFLQKVPVLHVCLVIMAGNCFWCILEEMFLVTTTTNLFPVDKYNQ